LNNSIGYQSMNGRYIGIGPKKSIICRSLIASFNITMGHMTEISQWKKKTDKNECDAVHNCGKVVHLLFIPSICQKTDFLLSHRVCLQPPFQLHCRPSFPTALKWYLHLVDSNLSTQCSIIVSFISKLQRKFTSYQISVFGFKFHCTFITLFNTIASFKH